MELETATKQHANVTTCW